MFCYKSIRPVRYSVDSIDGDKVVFWDFFMWSKQKVQTNVVGFYLWLIEYIFIEVE